MCNTHNNKTEVIVWVPIIDDDFSLEFRRPPKYELSDIENKLQDDILDKFLSQYKNNGVCSFRFKITPHSHDDSVDKNISINKSYYYVFVYTPGSLGSSSAYQYDVIETVYNYNNTKKYEILFINSCDIYLGEYDIFTKLTLSSGIDERKIVPDNFVCEIYNNLSSDLIPEDTENSHIFSDVLFSYSNNEIEIINDIAKKISYALMFELNKEIGAEHCFRANSNNEKDYSLLFSDYDKFRKISSRLSSIREYSRYYYNKYIKYDGINVDHFSSIDQYLNKLSEKEQDINIHFSSRRMMYDIDMSKKLRITNETTINLTHVMAMLAIGSLGMSYLTSIKDLFQFYPLYFIAITFVAIFCLYNVLKILTKMRRSLKHNRKQCQVMREKLKKDAGV